MINLRCALNSPRRRFAQLNMNITLTPELEKLVQTKVARGEYGSADTFVSEAVQRLIDEESGEEADHGEIRARIEAAEAEIDGEQCIEYNEATIQELVNGVHDHGLKRPAAEREDTGVRG
jgi:putative addiction module CopG family antidote